MGKSSINGPFSMAMLNNQRVHFFTVGCVMAVVEQLQSCTYKFLNDDCEDGCDSDGDNDDAEVDDDYDFDKADGNGDLMQYFLSHQLQG